MTHSNLPGDINIKGKLFSFKKPVVMGIINITPDSFYPGSRKRSSEQIKAEAYKMIIDGASILDIGAYSSRPGAAHISEKEELLRLEYALTSLREQHPEAIISVDTFRSNVALEVVENFKVDIINDISAGSLDDAMFDTIAKLNVPYIIMHMKGTPQNMQQNTEYSNDIMLELNLYFRKKIEELTRKGVDDVIIDPGLGFSKTLEQNYVVLRRMEELNIHQLPILIGLSRKSMIYNALNTTPEHSLNGTTILNTIAIERGANILRVHDVKEAVESIKLVEKMKTSAQ